MIQNSQNMPVLTPSVDNNQATNVPTMEQANSQFMANNPQYSAPASVPTPPPVTAPNPVAPVVAPQASYTGGQMMPAQGTPEFAQAQQIASTPTTPSPATPATPTTPTSTENYVSGSNQIQSQYDTALNNFQTTYEGIRTGSVPLSPYEQSQLDATRQSFQAIIEQQKIYNANLIGGTQVAQEARGLSRYSPEIAMGNIYAAQTEANKRVSELNSQMQLSLSQMERGFRTDNMKAVKESFDALTAAKEAKQAQLDKLYTVTKNEEEKVMKAGQEQTLSSINQTLLNPNLNKEDKKKKIAELIASGKLTSEQMSKVQTDIREQEMDEFNMMLSSEKFSYQQKQDAIDNAFKAGDLDLKKKNLMLDAVKAGLEPNAFISGAPGSGMGAINNANKSEMLTTVGLVNSILNDDYLSNVTGLKTPGAAFGGFFGNMYGSSTVKVQNQIKQLTAALSLEKREKLKGSGAVSDFEARTLERATSAFSTGLKDKDAEYELTQIKGALSNAAGLEVPVKVKDPKTGQFQVVTAGRAGVDAAIADGMLVEYQ